jgi:non-ribosomal peptide synthetase component E (peptide arylation enzyme)
MKSGAGKESRTLDLNLGKVALYQLSYSRTGTKKLHPKNHLEREKSLELSTSTLARLRSTN